MVWVYLQTEPDVFTVGFYDPRGNWHSDSDHPTRESARKRVALLNGGNVEMVWVYLQTEPDLFTVGFYDPRGNWHSDSDHPTRESARKRVALLNGANVEFNE